MSSGGRFDQVLSLKHDVEKVTLGVSQLRSAFCELLIFFNIAAAN